MFPNVPDSGTARLGSVRYRRDASMSDLCRTGFSPSSLAVWDICSDMRGSPLSIKHIGANALNGINGTCMS